MRFVLLAIVVALLLGTGQVALAAFARAAETTAPTDAIRLAYLDPGSGSFVVQALIAMFAGIIVTSRMYWSKIKSFLGLPSAAADEHDEDEDDV